MDIKPDNNAEGITHRKFGAFLGVFTPSVLTILGVIMYLRFGWVVASVGLGGALLIVLMCSAVAFITAFSASAVATNMQIGPGGEYYLVSRSLGLPVGGAIGIPLFLCRILSVTLYCYGLAEAFAMFWPAAWGPLPLPWIAAGMIVLVVAVSGKSASVALTAQIPLMAVVGLSIIALAVGVLAGPLHAPQWLPSPERVVAAGGFWAVLAVYFPAITGFNAGIGMSGDLKDPRKAIPAGTLSGVTVGTFIYLLVPILLAITAKVTADQMANINPQDPPVWTRIALLGGIVVLPGMWAAILSSAFGSALAGPRVLQALARDGLAPAVLARTSKTGQPTLAAWVSGLVALAAVALGNLNAVATVVTIFFLTLYLSINVVAAVESLIRDPSYRPTIRVHWTVALLGAVGCLVLMFLVSPLGCVIAITLELLVWLYLRERALKASWGDAWAGIWGSLARLSLLKLGRPRDPRSWRPNILLFADQLEQRLGLVRMAAWFNQNRGVLTVSEVVCGRPEEEIARAQEREAAMGQFLSREGISAFPEVDIVEEHESGVIQIAQANGFGGLRSNTIIFGWPSRKERLEEMLRTIRTLYHIGKAGIIIRPQPNAGPQQFRRIDVWWRGKENNGDLMLLLAYLLKMNPLWRRARIMVRCIAEEEGSCADMGRSLDELVRFVRIRARADVVTRPPDRSVADLIREISRDADVVFLGMGVTEPGKEGEHAQWFWDNARDLPTLVLVRNSGPLAGRLI